MTATADQGEIIMINDIGRAFFHARVESNVYVQLPKEDQAPGEEKMWEILVFHACDARRCSKLVPGCSQQFSEIGSQQGAASPCIFLPQKERGPAHTSTEAIMLAVVRRRF